MAESAWSNKYKVTFTDQGWGNKDVTVDDPTSDDIQDILGSNAHALPCLFLSEMNTS